MIDRLEKLGKPFHIYANLETLDQNALDQFVSAMEQDCAVQGALMPDAHKGYSLPIGGVVATKGMVFPSWVGYDIGCGMCATRLDVSKDDIIANSDNIFNEIYKNVPVGFAHHATVPDGTAWGGYNELTDLAKGIFNDCGAMKQLGTLGSGNHFIEIGYDENDDCWIIIHSGSRGFGWKVAQAYMKLASPNGKASEGHFGLKTDYDLGIEYINDMQLCLNFALANRMVINGLVLDSIKKFVDCYEHIEPGYNYPDLINKNHNHAVKVGDLWIHRKGATHAEMDMMGVIPGNMRDGSFIVRGKGNPESLWSSSHGAGRISSRKAIKETTNVLDFEQEMLGIKAMVSEDTLDESPFAYKNIFDVMLAQKDLVEIVHRVRPLINVKGVIKSGKDG